MFFISLIAAFIMAVLSGLGVGGGGLFVIYLALFTNIPQLEIQGINLAFFLFSSTSSLIIHLRKRKIFTTAITVMSIFGIIGALAGSFLATTINQGLLRKIFGTMLIVSGIISIKSAFKVEKLQNETDI